MKAYIYFTNCAVVFTPSAMAEGSHTVISVVAPAFPRRHQYNTETGRREIAVYVPTGFTGKFVVTVATDYPKRQKNAARLHRLGVAVEKGVIIGIVNLDYDRLPYVEVRFPSGYWGELGANWQADDWEVWVDLPTGWDNE